MRIAISKNLTERIPIDLALVIALTLACIIFVMVPPLNETPVRVVLGLVLVLFLPGYSLIAALFPGRDDLDGTRADCDQVSGPRASQSCRCSCLLLNYTPFGSRLGACACRALGLRSCLLWLRACGGGWFVVGMTA